ncbi:hypothetical protein KQ247_13895 [Ruegeria pomeroyi]|nr:hypothetical protein [Ruegeria pomeroyi]NVL01521.1 hypothetical protein [Ruegeria pomeroyi]QWV07917.1 hypothetical protein KQ247_13895 [Ruegeria pomeroyi]HCE70077.1 hypothetical protein [Ruegeria sp.]
MADENDKQAEALIAALAPKIAEAILPQITESVETQIKGVVTKNDELLDKLAKQKADDNHSKLLAAAESQYQARLDGNGLYQGRKPGDSIKIKKSDARSVSKYREAKALAEKEGVPLEIVAND